MKVIKELHTIIRELTSRKDSAFSYLFKPDNLTTKLLERIVDGEIETDEDAIRELFGSTAGERQSFRKTKSFLISRLISMCQFVNLQPPAHSLYLSNTYRAKREILVAEFLQWFQLQDSYLFVVRRTIKTAKAYHLTDDLLRGYQILRNHHSKHGTHSECLKYAKLVTETSRILLAEIQSANLRTTFQSESVNTLTVDSETVTSYKSSIELLRDEVERYQTRTLRMNYCQVAGTMYRMLGEFEEAKSIYLQYFEFLKNNPKFSYNAQIAMTLYWLVRCCSKSGELKMGHQYAEQAIGLVKIGTFNWFTVQEAHFLLCLQSGSYKNATVIFSTVVTQPQFRKLAIRAEKWGIYEAYLRLFNSEESLPLACTVHGETYSSSHVLQELEEIRQDKRGFYIPILIFQVLHYLRIRAFDLLDSRITACKDYLHNHVPKDSLGRFVRTDSLFRMFMAMRASEYQVEKTNKRIESHLAKITGFPQPDIPQSDSVQIEEIIPYENLWQWVVQELEQIEREKLIVRPLYLTD